MRIGYADPPYIGQAKKHYGKRAAEVNHPLLIAHLCDDFPDGWALSCSSNSLRALLPLCPDDVRVGAWVKPYAVFKPGVRPVYAWEPLIFRGGRQTWHIPNPRDWFSGNIDLQNWQHRTSTVVGTKPQEFCFWLFDVLGLQPGDELVDLFPGSGAVTEAWHRYLERLPLAEPQHEPQLLGGYFDA